jgi:CheY-like chemotaxis protein
MYAATILIIEDEPELLGLFKTIIRRFVPSTNVITAQGGDFGIRVLHEQTPEIIMLDLAMPNVDGNAVIDYIISEPRLNRTVILLVTAVPTRLHENVRQRVNTIMTKPITPRELEQTIKHYLSQLQTKGDA